MQIERIKISELQPYKLNAKEHPQSQIEKIKKSIQDFGFNDPIAIDEIGVVIEGHGRLQAMKELGEEYIDAIRLSHLTEEQKKAYILVHNKLTLDTGFNAELLEMELADITGIDMSGFGFELPEDLVLPEEPEETDKEHHRETTNKHYNLDLCDASRVDGYYEIPTLKKTDHIPEELIGFNYMLTSNNKKAGIHCFVDDYQFERVWSRPAEYLDKIKEYDCFLTPDFSLYMDMPYAMKLWNVYRSRLIGQYMQDNGVTVIPTISWAEPKTFQFAFDGIEKGSVVAVSTIGVKRSDYSMDIWARGMDAMVRLIEPSVILEYGGDVGYDYGNIKVVRFKNQVTERMREEKQNGNAD